MAQTQTAATLLTVAVQDLFDAEQAWREHLPALASQAGASLTDFVKNEWDRSTAQAARLGDIAGRDGADPAGAPNIWLRAILDDAARDTRMIAAGPLRDIALVGAFRKAKQSERVSYETAIGLAGVCGDRRAAQLLGQSRDKAAQADRDLAAVLATLLQSIE